MVSGRAPGRVHRPAGADIVDNSNCYAFVNSLLSLAGFALSAEIELSRGCLEGDS